MTSEALRYHAEGRPGKIEVALTKPCLTQRDLSLAYTPGVAEPCREIARDPDTVFDYTAKGNLVAVVSNGTAVLGLGNIGAAAGKPVMEGKGVLFKRFADIDVFDLEVAELDPDRLIEIVLALEPTFGGINLEDIKAPECFYIEEQLKQRMTIPVFHDDQHGTAIISGAALLNAAEIQGKRLQDLRVTVSGAGASAIACMNLWQRLGVRGENILMCDSRGVLHEGRRGSVAASKEPYLRPTEARTLADAMHGADVFIGLSVGGMVDAEMLRVMNDRPIILPLANPDPEVPYPVAREVRPDAVIGTGRSDYPNQVNNVLGFPFIFRGALDVGARQINEEMKLAASHALAELAREDVPDRVRAAYGGTQLRFGPEYILPKPLDERVLLWVAPAVALAAIETGVARRTLDPLQYRSALERRLGPAHALMSQVNHRVSHSPRRIIFPEAGDDRVLRAAAIVAEERLARPVLLGDPGALRTRAETLGLSLEQVEIVPLDHGRDVENEVAALLELRGRKGLTAVEARARLTEDPTTIGLMMVRRGEAEGLVAGLRHGYPETIRLALRLVGLRSGVRAAAGVHVLVGKRGPLLFADTTVNIDPDPRVLADIARMAAGFSRELGIEPHIALLSFSNFGASSHREARKVAAALRLVREEEPELDIEGEMQAQVALDLASWQDRWPHVSLRSDPNVFVFPNLGAANTAYQLVARLGGIEDIGPVLLGLRQPITVVPLGSSVETLVHLATITALHALTLQ